VLSIFINVHSPFTACAHSHFNLYYIPTPLLNHPPLPYTPGQRAVLIHPSRNETVITPSYLKPTPAHPEKYSKIYKGLRHLIKKSMKPPPSPKYLIEKSVEYLYMNGAAWMRGFLCCRNCNIYWPTLYIYCRYALWVRTKQPCPKFIALSFPPLPIPQFSLHLYHLHGCVYLNISIIQPILTLYLRLLYAFRHLGALSTKRRQQFLVLGFS